MQLVVDIPSSKISFVEELLRSISFVRDVKALDASKKKKMPHCIGIDMPGFKFSREEANER